MEKKQIEDHEKVMTRRKIGMQMLISSPLIDEFNEQDLIDMLKIFERVIERLKAKGESDEQRKTLD